MQPSAGVRAGRPALEPRFSGPAPDGLQGFQDVLEKSDILQDYNVDLMWAYPQLSERAQNYIEKLTQQKITPAEVEWFQQNNKLGFVEEGADLIYEFYGLLAARKNLITPQNVVRWSEQVTRGEQQGTPFFNVFSEVRKSLDADQVTKFQNATGLPEKETRNILGLLAMKFGLYESRFPGLLKAKSECAQNMRSEAQELVEPGKGRFAKMRITLLSQLYSRLSFLPTRFMRELPRKYAEKQIGVPLRNEDLMKNVILKQLGRQELDYDHPEWSRLEDKKLRKRILKPFEELVEASIVKDCMLRAEGNTAEPLSKTFSPVVA